MNTPASQHVEALTTKGWEIASIARRLGTTQSAVAAWRDGWANPAADMLSKLVALVDEPQQTA